MGLFGRLAVGLATAAATILIGLRIDLVFRRLLDLDLTRKKKEKRACASPTKPAVENAGLRIQSVSIVILPTTTHFQSRRAGFRANKLELYLSVAWTFPGRCSK